MNNKPIKILILTANPRNTDPLRLSEEVREIEEELERAKNRDRFELVSKWAVRIDDVSRALLENDPQIVHFSGHGGGSEGLVLEDEIGKMQFVKTDSLVRLFRLSRGTVQCVFLNACYSKVQAEAIHRHINCVIGMNQVIGDQAAIKFAAKFYQALATGKSFQYAYEFACTALDLSGSQESSTPELLNRVEGDDPFAILTATHNQPNAVTQAQPQSPAQQSQSIGNVTTSGNNNLFNAIQSGGNVTLTQTTAQISSKHPGFQLALEALEKLKQEIAATDALNSTEKEMVEIPIKKLETELQKSQPDKSIVDRAIATLKKILDGVIALADPVTKVATLIAKAWIN